MAEMIRRSFGGGTIAKSVKLQVFLSPNSYIDLVTEARKNGVTWRTDSELIGKIAVLFFEQAAEIAILRIQNQDLKQAVDEKKEIIDKLSIKRRKK